MRRAERTPEGPEGPAGERAARGAARHARNAALRTDILRRYRQTGGRGRKLRQLTVLLKPYRARVIWMLVSLVLATAAALAPAPLAKFAIDDGIKQGDIGTLNLVVVAFVVSALVYWGATYLQTYLVGWVGQRALQDLRLRIFGHLQAQPVGFYERRSAGGLISRMTNDVQALDQLVTDSVVTLFSSSLTLIGTIGILMWLDLELALLTFLIFPVMALGSLAFRVVSADAYKRTRETISSITSYLQESLSGIRIVRSFGQEPQHLQRFRELNERNREANMVTVNLNAAYFPAVELLSALATVGILLYGGFQVIDGEMSAGVVIAFVLALNGFFDPIQQLSQVYTTYQSGMAALDKIFDLLDIEPDLVDAPDAVELGRLRGEIELRDVTFAYGGSGADEARAVSNVSLDRPARPDRRARRVDRRRQVDDRQARRALLRPDRGRRARRRPGPALGHAGLAAPPARDRPAGGLSLQRHDRRQHRLRAPGRNRRGGARRRRARSARRSSSRRSSTATTRRSASAARSCRPASASSSRSRARSSPTRGS